MKDDSYVFENLSCVDADGREFRHFDRLFVNNDVFRTGDGSVRYLTPYEAIVVSEEDGLFLPDSATTCAILAAAHRAGNTNLLDQYKRMWHVQNTLVDFESSEAIHYPTASDFGRTGSINAGKECVALPFDKSRLCDNLLNDELRDKDARRYVRQLTGLEKPEVLVELGEYFGRPAKLLFPWDGYTGSNYSRKNQVWLGCNLNSFNLFAGNFLSGFSAARGVRASDSEPRAEGAQKISAPAAPELQGCEASVSQNYKAPSLDEKIELFYNGKALRYNGRLYVEVPEDLVKK